MVASRTSQYVIVGPRARSADNSHPPFICSQEDSYSGGEMGGGGGRARRMVGSTLGRGDRFPNRG